MRGKRNKVKARITTNHSSSSYGQPIVVLDDGEPLDYMSRVGCDYTVIKATKKEMEALHTMGLI